MSILFKGSSMKIIALTDLHEKSSVLPLQRISCRMQLVLFAVISPILAMKEMRRSYNRAYNPVC
jgi:hypothetical protein